MIVDLTGADVIRLGCVMERLTLQNLDAHAADFDARVAARPDVDRFCSSSPWILPAARALMPDRQPWIRRGAHGYAAFMRGCHPEGWRYLQALEAMWGFACPLAGHDATALCQQWAETCWQERDAWEVLMVSGLRPDSPLLQAAGDALTQRFQVEIGPVTTRMVVDLRDGPEGFLQRRGRGFRRGLERARRRTAQAGIQFVRTEPRRPEDVERLYERIQDVERRSWKGRTNVGINVGGMRTFYEQMMPRLASRNALHLVFGQCDGVDVAYVLGGIAGRTYRGLQLSFDHAYQRHGLGNVAQLETMQRLWQNGVETYDMGQEAAYKRRWADACVKTVTLVAWR